MNGNKKYLAAVTVLILLLFIVGCSADQVDPIDEEPQVQSISGTIYTIEENRILVVEGIDNVNVPWSEWFEAGKRAVFFSIEADTVVELGGETVSQEILSRGQKVEAWHSGFLAESYPEQGKADKVVILDQTAAPEAKTDTGRYFGLTEDGLLAVKISGTPDEMPARLYRMTEEAADLLNKLDLVPEEEIIIRYIEGDQSDGLIYDIALIDN